MKERYFSSVYLKKSADIHVLIFFATKFTQAKEKKHLSFTHVEDYICDLTRVGGL
jgi:hypothetical protein